KIGTLFAGCPVNKRSGKRRFNCAHQVAARRVLDAADYLAHLRKKLFIVPNPRTPHHQVAIIVGEPLGNPKSASVRRLCEIPWSELNGPQTFYVPYVKEFV